MFIAKNLFIQSIFLVLGLISPLKENKVINNFSLNEHSNDSSILLVSALDSLNNIQLDYYEETEFTINGLSYKIKFKEGVSKINNPLKQSGFLYIKHENDFYKSSHLYYLMNNFAGINLIEINLIWLLAIPIGIFILGFLFRKLLYISVIIFIIYIYFSYSGGLKFSTVLEYIVNIFQSII